MALRWTLLAVASCLATGVAAQTDETPPAAIEEVTITAPRATRSQRLQLQRAEQRAYDLFNRYNDDKRFRISCSEEAPTGSKFKRQVCQPEFEQQALRAHGQAYLDSVQAMLDPGRADEGTIPSAIPVAAAIAAQQPALRRKMKQVAEQHPDFLEAVIEYGRLRQQYQGRDVD
ncbi:MAG: hypothetical protein IT494_00685 [Gammaproteobacteria bacterium]|nr:hypothetical protein [Gammaproteobacteria bacterium]